MQLTIFQYIFLSLVLENNQIVISQYGHCFEKLLIFMYAMHFNGILRFDNNFEWFGVEIDWKIVHLYFFMANVQ